MRGGVRGGVRGDEVDEVVNCCDIAGFGFGFFECREFE